jgi:hypothetical protein
MKRLSIALVTMVVLASIVGLSSTNHVSGSWSKNNVSMSGTHTATWIQPPFAKIAELLQRTPAFRNNSVHLCRCTAGRSLSERKWSLVKLADLRLSGKSGEQFHVSGNAIAQGQYQDCINGHQYRNTSRHIFNDTVFGLSETHTLTSQ